VGFDGVGGGVEVGVGWIKQILLSKEAKTSSRRQHSKASTQTLHSKLNSTGADPHLHDNLGRTALLEAAFAGHDSLISALVRAGAHIGGAAGDMSEVEVAALLCRWVEAGRRKQIKGWAAVCARD